MQATDGNLAHVNGDEERVRRLLAPLYQAPEQSAILSDIDGTLAPIAPRPQAAQVPVIVSRELAQLVKAYRLVACISGRRALEARQMVGVEGMTYLGNHGYELLDPKASEPEIEPEALRYVGVIKGFVERFAPGLKKLDVRIEDKQEVLALHWRGAPDENVVASRMKEIAEDATAEGLRAHWGRKVLEIRPPIDADKGTALASLLKSRNVKCALYAGDDLTDLDAFNALHSLRDTGDLSHAVCIGVDSQEGPQEITARADLVVQGVEGVAEVLSLLAEMTR